MKKTFKWIFGAFVALMLVFATTGVAIAAGAGKITVADPGAEDYRAYKIFDASANAQGDVTYTIPSNSPWHDVIFQADGSLQPGVEGLERLGSSSPYTVKKTNSFVATDFANFLKSNIPAGATPIEFTDAAADNLDLGYYMVVSSLDDFETLQARAALTTVLDDQVTIQNKNDMPFDKTADGAKQSSVQVGQVINFRIDGVVPNVADSDTFFAYIVTDVLDEGLTFNNDLAVTINDESVTLREVTDPSVSLTDDQVRYGQNGKTFEISLDMEERGKDSVDDLAGAPVVITYTATVNADAEGVVNRNFAQLEFGNDPNNLTVKDSETEHYTSKIVIDKFETDAPEQKLAGAKFVLKNAEGKFYAIDADDEVSWVADQADATEVTTDTNGRAEFIGLADGNYQLVETAAPAGYTQLLDPIAIEVKGEPALNVNNTAEQIAMDLQQVVSVSNTPGSLIPSTGGMGTMALYGAGALALILAVVMVVRKRSEA